MNCSEEDLESGENSSEPIYLFLQTIQVLICVSALFSFFFIFKKYRHIYIDPNIKILMRFYAVSAVAYCISFILIQSYHIFSRIFFEGCDLLVPARICVFFRIILSWSSFVFQLFYISITIQIILSECFQCCQNTFWLPRILGGTMYYISAVAVKRSLDDLYSSHLLSNCASFETRTKSAMIIVHLMYLGFDIFSLASYIFIRTYINVKLSIKKTRYDINKTMRRKELQRVYFLMLPNILLHFICYLYNSLSTVQFFLTYSNLFNPEIEFLLTNVVPVYILFSPIIWGFVLRRQKQQQNNEASTVEEMNNSYFNQLAQQWK